MSERGPGPDRLLQDHQIQGRYRAEEGSFVTWMFRIAHNANIDHYHSLERSRNDVRIDETDVRGDGDPDDDFLKKERARRIKEALGRIRIPAAGR